MSLCLNVTSVTEHAHVPPADIGRQCRRRGHPHNNKGINSKKSEHRNEFIVLQSSMKPVCGVQVHDEQLLPNLLIAII